MIRITKLTDYGIVLLSRIARDSHEPMRTVRDLAEETHVPIPTVSKILKQLAHQRLLISHLGVKGGYSLARRPEEITMADIIGALDGPIAITDCSGHAPGKCELERLCAVRSNWQQINLAIRETLEGITLADMAQPLPTSFIALDTLSLGKFHRTEAMKI